jgi:hypothetical protein
MDWNIFFSTVSQTAGAIVGIFSAFLITKIVSNQTTYGQKIDELSEYLSVSKKLSNEARIRYFKWYHKRTSEDQLDELLDDYDESKKLKSADDYYEQLNFSPYQAKEESLQLINQQIEKIEIAEIEAEEKRKSQLEKNGSSFFLVNQPLFNVPKVSAFVSGVTEERECIDDLFVRVQHQCNLNKGLFSSLKGDGESSKLISISIISVLLLFFIGVIYPLSFLPLEVGKEITLSVGAFWDILFSLKGAMLTLISLIFSGLMIVFYVANRRLKYKKVMLKTLSDYINSSNYSEYFQNYNNNQNT